VSGLARRAYIFVANCALRSGLNGIISMAGLGFIKPIVRRSGVRSKNYLAVASDTGKPARSSSEGRAVRPSLRTIEKKVSLSPVPWGRSKLTSMSNMNLAAYIYIV
jgi:hypothetical protein